MTDPVIKLQEYQTNLDMASADVALLFHNSEPIENNKQFLTNINAYFDKFANITNYITNALESINMNSVISNISALIQNDQLHQNNFNQVMERLTVLENEFMERSNNKNEPSYSSMYAGSKKTRKNRRHKK
jgi:hypothetical protein